MVLHNFIVFEGIDGAGTSTQLKLLQQRPDADRFFFTAEPTDAPTGTFLRSMLRGTFTVDPRTAAYLFAADRVEHVWGANGAASVNASGNSATAAITRNGVADANACGGNATAALAHNGTASADSNSIAAQCARGKLVVSDRYLFSSLAYQSIDCGMELPRTLNSIFPLPELLFFFDIAPEAALARVDSRGERELYEQDAFLRKVRAAYHDVLSHYSDSGMRIITLDAAESAETVAATIAAALHAQYGI